MRAEAPELAPAFGVIRRDDRPSLRAFFLGGGRAAMKREEKLCTRRVSTCYVSSFNRQGINSKFIQRKGAATQCCSKYLSSEASDAR